MESAPKSVLLHWCSAFVTWRFGVFWRCVSSMVATMAVLMIYWSPRPAYVAPTLVQTFYTAVLFVLVISGGHRRFLIVSGTLLTMPFLYSAVSTVWAVRWVVPIRHAVLAFLCGGLLGSAWSVMRSTAPKREEILGGLAR